MSAAQTEDPWTRWIELSDSSIRPEDVNNILSPVRDDLWVVTACVDRLLDTPDAQRALLDLGIVRTLGASERSQLVYNGDVDEEVAQLSAEDVANKEDALLKYWQASPDARLCHMRAVLLHRLDRLNTFVEMCIEFKPTDDELPTSEEDTNLGGEEWEDDPWASEADETSTTAEEAPKSLVGDHSSSDKAMPISLSLFLSEGLAHSASLLASLEQFPALKILFDRHADELWPHRLSILERIPEHAHPEDYRDILPSYNVNAERERRPADHPWRTDTDWTELSTIQSLLERNFPDLLIPTHTIDLAQKSEPLTSTALVEWYITTADRIMSVAGMIDIALELIQHGASQGLPSLAELGEDLSLLSRLIYDAPTGPLGPSVDDWTLRRWRAMEPLEVVQAYLAYSTPASIVSDIRTLVQPYLFVIESRAERAGKPDPELPTRLLYQYVLSAPLHLVAAIFDASKPIYPAAQRLLKSDEDLARLALSCLYGSPTLDAWPTMSRIFECMPAWNFAADVDDNGEAAETTATSLGAFVTPTVQRPRATPAELLLFFQPLDAPALSRALDILDVHLESGEILARWGVPAPLRWFLQSRSDEREQRTWAVRMSRRADNFGERVDTEDTWEWLLDDMLKLAGSGESGLRGAFGLLSRDEVIRIFFSGVISAGDFGIAKSLLRKAKQKLSLESSAIEDICLACSREFYDNASSGNYRIGDMKLAYDCLDIPPPSDKIVKEKEFIEATSSISSFNVMSRPGIPISPIEVRLTKDRLSLVSRVLSSTNDAYKHTQIILDLAYKLGYRDDPVAKTRVLAMIADTALQAEDFDTAFDTSEDMVASVLELRASLAGSSDPRVEEASEVCWVACYQLGRQPEFPDVNKKMSLLGRALELCPADRLPDILTAWRRLETEFLEERESRSTEPRGRRIRAAARSHVPSLLTPLSAPVAASAASLASRLQQGLHMSVPSSPDAAALASKTLSRVAAGFSFGRRDRSVDSVRPSSYARSGSREGSISRPGSTAPGQASRALQKGIGWLIGADGE